MVIFQYNLYIFGLDITWLFTNTVYAMDPIYSVIKRLWCLTSNVLQIKWLPKWLFFSIKTYIVGQVNVLKFCTPKFLTKWHMQRMQIQIRQLLKEQSDQGLHCLPFCLEYFEEQLHKKQNTGKKVWNLVFEILGHLLYSLKACYWGTSNENPQHVFS